MNEWTESAVCAQVDAELFFPPDGMRGEKLAQWEHDARQVCRECPVRRQCLDEAMRREKGAGRAYRHGMWGGLTPEQRISLERGAAARQPTILVSTPCVGYGCDRTLRPRGTHAGDYPGTWEHAGRGMCSRCYNRDYKRRRAELEAVA